MDFRIAIVILLVAGVLSSYLFLVPAVSMEPQKQCTQKYGLVPVACVPDGTLYKRLMYCEAV